jgi:hypothetical protein
MYIPILYNQACPASSSLNPVTQPAHTSPTPWRYESDLETSLRNDQLVVLTATEYDVEEQFHGFAISVKTSRVASTE